MSSRRHGGDSNTEQNEIAEDDEKWILFAQELAAQGGAIGEIPVGAVIVQDGEILGKGFNCPITSCDPTAHAEVVALRAAAQCVQNYRLVDSTLYVTLEPCTMCVGAIVHARIKRLVFGAMEPKAGSVVSRAQLLSADYLNHKVSYSGGIGAESCSHQLSDFFKMRRAQKKINKNVNSNPQKNLKD